MPHNRPCCLCHAPIIAPGGDRRQASFTERLRLQDVKELRYSPAAHDVLWTLAVVPCRMFRRLTYATLDRAGCLMTLALLRLYDWHAGPVPETAADRVVREEGERLRKAFPKIDFDDPTPRRNRLP